MLQEIIAYLIIIMAFGFLLFNILKFFNLAGKKIVSSSKCGGCSSGCEMKELHQIVKRNSVKTDQYKYYL
jgi:hypothetical protein